MKRNFDGKKEVLRGTVKQNGCRVITASYDCLTDWTLGTENKSFAKWSLTLKVDNAINLVYEAIHTSFCNHL